MNNAEYTKLVDSIGSELITAVKADVAAHVASIADVLGLYGYSIQTPDYTCVDQPIVVYNCEEDVPEEHRDEVYYRYSVDEWEHYHGYVLPKTTALTTAYDNKFLELSGDNDEISGDAYRRKVYDCFTVALEELKADKTWADEVFLVVWPREEDIILDSAKRLNSPAVFEAVESEFG